MTTMSNNLSMLHLSRIGSSGGAGHSGCSSPCLFVVGDPGDSGRLLARKVEQKRERETT